SVLLALGRIQGFERNRGLLSMKEQLGDNDARGVADVDLQRRERLPLTDFSGDYGGGATPDPIPNSVVKPSSADGTAGGTLWESRTLPDLWAGSARSRPMPF